MQRLELAHQLGCAQRGQRRHDGLARGACRLEGEEGGEPTSVGEMEVGVYKREGRHGRDGEWQKREVQDTTGSR